MSAPVSMPSRLPDLVLDSKLRAGFCDSITIHSYLEIDEIGRRFTQTEHWKWEQFLRRGGSGQVRLERCVTAGAKQGSVRAVKTIDKPLNSPGSLDYNRELETIAKFSNDRYKRWFVKSFGWFEDPTSIFVTMEYCRHGDLQHYLKSKGLVPAGEAQQLAYQMLEGLDQMHQNGFAHRDLKPGNILIKSMPPEEKWWIVLADFGISKRADERNRLTSAIKGTTAFMAPELLGYLDQITHKFTLDSKAADMWALGETVFRMLTGEAAFQNPGELMTYCIGQREFPSNRLPISTADDGHMFVSNLMMVVPQDRPTTTQCIQHCWMKSLREEVEYDVLNLEQSNLLVTNVSSDESASARWSSLSNLDHRPTQTTSERRLERLSYLDNLSARQTEMNPTFNSALFQHDPDADQESSFTSEESTMQMLEGHSAHVCKVTFSPDGMRLASTSMDGAVRLWDARSGKVLQGLQNYQASTVTFSPDSKWLATSSNDETVQLWDARYGQELVQTLKGHLGRVAKVTFSPNGKQLASASSDETVRLWDAGSGALMQTLECRLHWSFFDKLRFRMLDLPMNHTDGPWNVAFSPDGEQLAASTGDREVRLWDAGSGKLLHRLKSHTSFVVNIVFTSDSKHLASASFDETVRLWNAKSGTLEQTLEGHSDWVLDVAFSPDSKQLASASRDKTVRLWHVGSGELEQTLEGHFDQVTRVAFSPDGKQLASASDDRTIRLWDVRSGELQGILKGHSGQVSDIAFSSDGKQLASASSDKTVRLWHVGSRRH